MWRLVEGRRATLEEIDRHWTLLDVQQANEVLDAVEEARAEVQRMAMERARER